MWLPYEPHQMWYQETNKTHESLKDEEKKKNSKKYTKDIEQEKDYEGEARMFLFNTLETSFICELSVCTSTSTTLKCTLAVEMLSLRKESMVLFLKFGPKISQWT